MSKDSLSKPLGLDPPARAERRPIAIILGVCSFGVALLAALVAFDYDDVMELLRHQNIRQTQTAAIAIAAPPVASPSSHDINVVRVGNEPIPPLPAPTQATLPTALSDGRAPTAVSAPEIERESGVKINRPLGVEATGLFIPVPAAEPQNPDVVSVSLPLAPDQRLLERSRFGLLPRVGSDGARPAQVYARPVVATGMVRMSAPRIALMIGGMGLNTHLTYTAIDRLPEAVSLAFAPYGDEREHLAGRARARGHEVILQMPMQSFDANDVPGPHTLMSGADTHVIDDAQWVMGRLTAYVGVANFLGGKLMAEPTSLAPVLREIGKRGLLFIDDGSSSQSVAMNVAADVGVPFVRADMNIDASTPEAVEAGIARLEVLAREKGHAMGVATGSALMIERLSAYARSLEGRGLLLVPVSSLAESGGRSLGLAR